MGKGRKLLLAITASVAIHAGAIGGAICVHNYFSGGDGHRPRIAKPVLHEEKPRPALEIKERKPNLEALEEEKKEYLDELLAKLNKGERIRLSEFFIKAEVLDGNIRLAEKGKFGQPESKFREKYFQVLGRANLEARDSNDEVSALHNFLHTKVFAGYFWGSGSVLDVLEKGWYNCASSTKLFSALMEDALGKKNYRVLVFDDHLANVVRGKRVDAVDGEWENTSKDFDGCGLVVPPEIFVAGYLLNNGIPREKIPRRLAAFYKVKKAWKGCPEAEKNLNDASFGSYALPAPGAKSGLSVPSTFIPNPKYKTKTGEIVKIARALIAAYKLSHLHEEKEFLQTELKGGTIKTNPIILPKVNWGEVLERFKSDFAANSMASIWPERVLCVHPFAEIPPETIPNIIESMPEKDAEKFRYYTKENICKRMKLAAEVGTIPETWGYQSYNFCPKIYPDVNEALKERYLREKNGDVLRFGLADSEIAGNFEFFLNEFRTSGDAEIRMKAAAGMLFSNKEKGCAILKPLPEKEKLELSQQLVLGCKDVETAWRKIVLGNLSSFKELGALGMLEGEMLSKEQCEWIGRNGVRGSPDAKMEIARILLECGSREEAMKYLKGGIEKLKSGESTKLGEGRFPREFNAALTPLIDEGLAIAKGMICNGGYTEYLPKVVNALRNTVKDEGAKWKTRVEAAYLLLKIGVEPVERE